MARKPRAIVLDSWAIMAYFEDEPAAEKVADIIAEAHEEDTPLFMSVVNAGEVWYILARRTSESEANRGVHELRQLGIEFIDGVSNQSISVCYKQNSRCLISDKTIVKIPKSD